MVALVLGTGFVALSVSGISDTLGPASGVSGARSGPQPAGFGMESVDSAKENSEIDAFGGSRGSRPVNVLLIGLDRAKGGEDGSRRADTLMLARTYPDTGEVKLLSVPRDLLVEGQDGSRVRINASHTRGGAGADVREVEELTGVTVDYYAAADFEGFKEIIDSLDGVEVQVRGDYLAHKGIPAGEQVLNGEEALLYARYRKTPRGDLGRIERQQRLLSALRSRALSLDSVTSVPAIFRSFREHVETNLGPDQALSLGRTLTKSEQGGGVESDQLEGEPVTLSDGRQVLLPDQERNERILYDFLD